MSYTLLYYTQVDGAWTIPDSGIKRIWERMIDDGAVSKVFYAGEIDTFEKFILYLKSPRTFPFFIFNDDRIDAMVWCTSVRGKSALLHFNVFRSGYGKGAELANAAFTHIFNLQSPKGERVINTIRGETPFFNRLACRYLKTIGMRILGEIPDMAHNKYTGETSPMVISYITYDQFIGGDYE